MLRSWSWDVWTLYPTYRSGPFSHVQVWTMSTKDGLESGSVDGLVPRGPKVPWWALGTVVGPLGTVVAPGYRVGPEVLWWWPLGTVLVPGTFLSSECVNQYRWCDNSSINVYQENGTRTKQKNVSF